MNKADLAKKIKLKCNLTMTKANEVVDTLIEELKSLKKREDKLILKGFGTFKVVTKKVRKSFDSTETVEKKYLIFRETKTKK